MKPDLPSAPLVDGLYRREFTDWDAIARLAAPWEAMHRRCRGALSSSMPWIESQRRNFGPGGTPCFQTLWQDESLVAAAPLVVTRAPISKRLPFYRPETLTGFTCQYTGHADFPAPEGPARAALAEAIAAAAKGRVVDLTLMREGPMRDQMMAALSRRGFAPSLVPQFESGLIEAGQSWEDYLGSRSASFRKTLRKAGRALDAAGVVRTVYREGPEDLLDRVFDVARRSWKHKTGTSLASRPETRAFVRDLWRALASTQDVVLTFLTREGTDFAYCIMLRCHGRWNGIWADFDEAYADCTPGRAIMCLAFESVMARGDTEIDVMRRTHHTGLFAERSYDIARLRAFQRYGPARAIAGGEALARNLVAAVRQGGPRTRKRRADTLLADAERTDA